MGKDTFPLVWTVDRIAHNHKNDEKQSQNGDDTDKTDMQDDAVRDQGEFFKIVC